jgi:hypothetical protein
MTSNVGSWDKLSDGSWGVMVRCGGRGTEMVGQTVVVRRKDRSTSNVMLGALVADYGQGDVAVYQVAS